MRFDDATIAVRERSLMEVYDLALLVVRQHLGRLLLLALIAIAPLALLDTWLLGAAMAGGNPWLVWMVLGLLAAQVPIATAPIAAHMIGRAAYISKAPLWENTLGDELKGKYDKKTHELTAQAETGKTEKGKRKKKVE